MRCTQTDSNTFTQTSRYTQSQTLISLSYSTPRMNQTQIKFIQRPLLPPNQTTCYQYDGVKATKLNTHIHCLKKQIPVLFSNNANKSYPVSIIAGIKNCCLIFIYVLTHSATSLQKTDQLSLFPTVRSTKLYIADEMDLSAEDHIFDLKVCT